MALTDQVEQLGINTANSDPELVHAPSNSFLTPTHKSAATSASPGPSPKTLSAFQILLLAILEAKGDMNRMPGKFKGPLRCSVKEITPNFLITDGRYFICAYFAKDC